MTYIDKLKERKYSDNIFYFFLENIKDFNNSLKAEKISKENIPVNLKSRYVSENGIMRVEVVPLKNLNDQVNKKEFVESMFKIAPNVSGGAFTTYRAGKTILQSFEQAMITSISLTTLFLFFTLRNFKKVFIVFFNLIAALLFSLSLLTLDSTSFICLLSASKYFSKSPTKNEPTPPRETAFSSMSYMNL